MFRIIHVTLGAAIAVGFVAPASSGAQDTLTTAPPPFAWKPRRDLAVLGGIAVAAAVVSPFDVRWTAGMQGARVQNDPGLRRVADAVRSVGNPGALVLSAGVFALGKVARRPGLADAGWHATEAVVASAMVTGALKGIVGRARPGTVDNTDAGEFKPFGGFRPGYSSMPSGHTTVAFAAAAAFDAELSRSRKRAARVVRPLLYTVAAAVGVSRLYHDSHWASDVVVGAGVGVFVARRLVAVAHGSRQRP